MNQVEVTTQLAAALAGSEGAADVFRAAVRLLADGHPVATTALATELGWTAERVTAVLARFPDAERNDAGDLIGLGLTLRPTAHAFEVDGRQLFTWCALDSLFLPSVLDRAARVVSSCAITGAPIRMTVTPDSVDDVDPPSAALLLVVPGSAQEVRSSFCNRVSFVTCASEAQEWLRANPEAMVVSVAKGFDIGRDFAARALDVRYPSCC